ncbi:GMP synthase [Verticillium alfalfae VaMs.102]|uniref:GMP synthase n=1 Tax=Verticillium alfalfae (strain VaMs.102 / ATCC MYA-4576 / FGSC 10136) TaxID=526221 RepID=C9S6T7_VERA1|nr:GMP synthase [Verticillium alfalfae VaMs.102]EEY15190.1 GMP synthase [Verticillium alfalfae VaMs.102]
MGSTPSPIRLAILEADTPLPETQATYKGYGGVFTALLRTAALTLPAPAPPRLACSRHTGYDDEPWILALVDYTPAASPRAASCIASASANRSSPAPSAGTVRTSPKGWEVAVTDVTLTPVARDLFGLDVLRIHQMHRDEVVDVPSGAESLAATDTCPVQGYYAKGRYIAVQGHPEFTGPIVAEILASRHKMGIFGDDMYAEAVERAGIEHDGVAVGRGFLNFLQQ